MQEQNIFNQSIEYLWTFFILYRWKPFVPIFMKQTHIFYLSTTDVNCIWFGRWFHIVNEPTDIGGILAEVVFALLIEFGKTRFWEDDYKWLRHYERKWDFECFMLQTGQKAMLNFPVIWYAFYHLMFKLYFEWSTRANLFIVNAFDSRINFDWHNKRALTSCPNLHHLLRFHVKYSVLMNYFHSYCF